MKIFTLVVSFIIQVEFVTALERLRKFEAYFDGSQILLSWNISRYSLYRLNKYEIQVQKDDGLWATLNFPALLTTTSYTYAEKPTEGSKYNFKIFAHEYIRGLTHQAETTISIPYIIIGTPKFKEITPYYIKLTWEPSAFMVSKYVVSRVRLGNHHVMNYDTHSTSPNFKDTNVEPCGVYIYQVVATIAINNATYRSNISPPISMSNITKPRDLVVYNDTDEHVLKIRWNNSLDPNYCTGVDLYVKSWILINIEPTNNYWIEYGLEPNMAYTFRVSTVESCEPEITDWAVSNTIITPDRPKRPFNSRASITAPGSVTFEWDPYNYLTKIRYFRLEKKVGLTGTWEHHCNLNPTFKKYTFTNLVPGTYFFRIAAVWSAVRSDWEVLPYFVNVPAY